MDQNFLNFIGQNVANIDLINIAPLDDLHHPSGMIDEAKNLPQMRLVLIILYFPFKEHLLRL